MWTLSARLGREPVTAAPVDGALLAAAREHEQAGRLQQAADIYRSLLARHGEVPELLHALALLMHRGGLTGKALQAMQRVCELAPTDAVARNNLANMLNESGRQRLALAAYEEALRLAPDYANAHYNVARLMQRADRPHEAIEHLRQVVRLAPDDVSAWTSLAAALRATGDAEALREAVARALALDPTHAGALTLRGDVALIDGDADAAGEWYRRAQAADPAFLPVYERIAASRRFGDDDAGLVAAVERMLEEAPDGHPSRASLHFALGKMHDDRGDFEHAFAHYVAGNRLRRADASYDRDAFAALVDEVIAVFDQRWLAVCAGAGEPSPLPVFVTGMPRSGTTLVEQILASHPAVLGAGELTVMEDLERALPAWSGTGEPYPRCVASLAGERLRALGREYLERLPAGAPRVRRVTDKLPFNFTRLGLVAAMLPSASLLLCERSAVDTCLSGFFQNYAHGHLYSTDLRDLAFVYRHYRRLARHWRDLLGDRLLVVRYEAVVEEFEQCATRLVEHCGLPWDDACLRPQRSGRQVQTASLWQVRQPVYRRSLERWRNYRPWIGELLEALAE